MRATILPLAGAAILFSATFAQAAGHETETMTAPEAMTEPTTESPAAMGAPGTYIVLGILAALLIAAAGNDSADGGRDQT